MGKSILPSSAKYKDAPFSLVVRVLSKGQMAAGGCYLWSGRTDRDGYGTTNYAHDGEWRIVLVHRLVYTRLVGDPGSLPVDHTCHDPKLCRVPPEDCPHRRCMNPDHLQAVTQAVNIARGAGLAAANAVRTHCVNGHEFTPENTYWRKSGGRRCRKCNSERMAAARLARKAGIEPLVKSENARRAARHGWVVRRGEFAA